MPVLAPPAIETRLRLADDLELPLEAVTQTIGILAKRGVGKTYTGAVFAEELLKAGQIVAIVDPVGVWFGLRAAADGTGPGLPITVLGGEHGDLPLAVDSGAAIADLLVEERIPLVLDLSLMRKGEMTRWSMAFFERLYHRNREPLQLILDEADAFAPQRPMGDQARMLGAVEDLVRRGRARGIGVTLITQRAAVINKDVLTQIEVLIVLRTLGPQDRAAIDEWIKIHGTPEQRAELMTSLASLPIGEAWFWSPGWLDVFQRVRIRRRETFDSSATPKAGQKRSAPRVLAPVDLERLTARLGDAIERARQDDPKALRQEIADLKRQLTKLQGRPTETKIETRIERVEVPVVPPAHRAALGVVTDRLVEGLRAIATAVRDSTDATADLRRLLDDLESGANPGTPAPITSIAERRQKAASDEYPGDGKPEPVRNGSVDPDALRLSGPQRRILDTLAAFEALGLRSAARSNVAVFSDASSTSSAFANNLGALRTAGLLDYPGSGLVALTDAGRALAEPAMRIESVSQLHDAWCAKLSGPQARILRVLVDRHPMPIDRVDLAEATGASATSSAFANNLGALRSLGLLDYPSGGKVVATSLLFPEGVPGW